MFFVNVMQRREGVGGQHGRVFTKTGAIQNFHSSLIMRPTILRHVQQDISVSGNCTVNSVVS